MLRIYKPDLVGGQCIITTTGEVYYTYYEGNTIYYRKERKP
jgi:hypothetical protein